VLAKPDQEIHKAVNAAVTYLKKRKNIEVVTPCIICLSTYLRDVVIDIRR